MKTPDFMRSASQRCTVLGHNFKVAEEREKEGAETQREAQTSGFSWRPGPAPRAVPGLHNLGRGLQKERMEELMFTP